jgi:lysophospholipase L1-like esterase
MKRILCYGDSNTHGTKPMRDEHDVARFGFHERWPGIAATMLGPEFEFVEEGLPGRTTIHDDPVEGFHKNGKRYLLACLESHWPLDAVILALGVNDLKARFEASPKAIADGIASLIDLIHEAPMFGRSSPHILVLSPSPILETGWLGDMFKGGAAKSRDLTEAFALMARRKSVRHVSLETVAEVSLLDGIHYDEANHHAIGHAVVPQVKALFT